MQPADKKPFGELITGVYEFYNKPCSVFTLDVWWQAMRPFDFSAVRQALSQHCVNPDVGQFLPRPADVVKYLRGSTEDGAMRAWSKVERATQSVGRYQTVVFDDPVIHQVIQDMGGWIALCNTTPKEAPFKAKEFQTRYRGYRLQGGVNKYPAKLIGVVEHENAAEGHTIPTPVYIGDTQQAVLVYQQGSDQPTLTIKTAAEALPKQLTETGRA